MRLFNRKIGQVTKPSVSGPETERFVPLNFDYDYDFQVIEPQGYTRSRGQALLIVALMMTMLVLMVGLGVDVGNLMGKRAKLQSAVDAAALSAAQLLADTSVPTNTVVTKAYQMLEANNVPSSTLRLRQVTVTLNTSQVRVQAVQRVDTFFMRLIPLWKQVEVSADATADLNAYAEINIKPFGIPGVVNELNISVWGPNSWRRGGDAYSPQYVSGNTANPEYPKMPYGYLYRIDIPASFPDDHLLVQIFDPDTYNNPTPAPTLYANYTPAPTTTTGSNTPTSTPRATATFGPNDGPYTYCGGTSATRRTETCLYIGAFPLTATPIPTVFAGVRRSGFWRVDEFRRDHSDPAGIDPCPGGVCTWDPTWADTTTYTLWHFDPHITSAFDNPANLSDLPGGASVATYTVGMDPATDLAWYQPNGFDVTLTDPSCTGSNHDCYARESNGNFYFYLYVKTSSGSSENNFDIRVGPRDTNYAAGYTCNDLSSPLTNICFANTQYWKQSRPSPPDDWDSGGNAPAWVFAKRAMPLNLDAYSANWSFLFTQVSKNAAGQTLAIKHFDQDCTGGCGAADTLQYQMQLCVNTPPQPYTPPFSPCSGSDCMPCPLTTGVGSDSCFGNVGTGWTGPNNDWYCPGVFADNCGGFITPQQPEKVNIPIEGTSGYNNFFGSAGQCASSWLRLQSDPSYAQDTTVWEMPFARPRLIK